jgi:hypothetical protein
MFHSALAFLDNHHDTFPIDMTLSSSINSGTSGAAGINNLDQSRRESSPDSLRHSPPSTSPQRGNPLLESSDPLRRALSEAMTDDIELNDLDRRDDNATQPVATHVSTNEQSGQTHLPLIHPILKTGLGVCPFQALDAIMQNPGQFLGEGSTHSPETTSGIGDRWKNYYVLTPPVSRLLRMAAPFPGIDHMRGSGWKGLFSGQGFNMLTSETLYRFLEEHPRKYLDKLNDEQIAAGATDGKRKGLVSMFLGDRPALYVGDSESLRAVFYTPNLTQASLQGESYSPLRTVEEVFGTRFNFVMVNNYLGASVNPESSLSRDQVADVTLNFGALNEFFKDRMFASIRRNFDNAEKEGPMDLGKLYFCMAIDVGMGLLTGVNTFFPSDFMQADERNHEFLDNVFVRMADPGLTLDAGKRREVVARTQTKMTEFGYVILRKNYMDVVHTKPNFIKTIWKNYAGLTGEHAGAPFPETPEAFSDIARNSTSGKALCDRVALLYGFTHLASSETSAVILDFATRYLMKDPSLMERVRQDAEQFVAQHGSLEQMEMENLKDFRYLSIFVLEVLRMHPPVAAIPWVVKEDYTATLPGGTQLDLKKGTWLFLDFERANRSGEWVNGDRFDPDRWLHEDCDYVKHCGSDIFAYLKRLTTDQTGFHSFSGDSRDTRRVIDDGLRMHHSRTCPGRYLAVPEIIGALAMLVLRYKISADREVSLEVHGPSTLRPKQQLNVTVTRP